MPRGSLHKEHLVEPSEQNTDGEPYDHHWGAVGGKLDAKQTERDRARVVVSAIPPDAQSVLEVGCGDGLIIDQVGCGDRMGMDISAIAVARVEAPAIVGSVSRIPFEDARWDAVVASEVLEHIRDAEYHQSTAEIARVARRYIVVTVPNRENLRQSLTRCPRCGRTYNASDHVRAYQPGSMSILFDGFRLAECREFGHPYRVWGGFETFLRQRLLGMTLPYTGVYACPGCGPDESPRRASGKDASSGGVSLTRRTLKKAVAGLGRARPRWIIAVYSRNLPI